jgi:general secretion pathway protein M
MKQTDALRNWYLALAPRERQIVTGGGIALLVIVIWLAIVSPWLNAQTALRQDVRHSAALLDWMQQATVKIKQLEKVAPSTSRSTPNQSLFATVEQTTRGTSINISQIQPRGNNKVQLHLDGAPFDALIGWLGRLRKSHGVTIAQLGVSRADAPGTVNADITLTRPATK